MSPFQCSGTTLRLDGCDYATSSIKEILAETGFANVTKCIFVFSSLQKFHHHRCNILRCKKNAVFDFLTLTKPSYNVVNSIPSRNIVGC